MIELINITKHYESGSNKLSVLNPISLSIKEGEIVSLVGPSGCGKTTLLKLIAGLEKPSTGKINIKDKSPANAIRSLAFAFNFQTPILFPWKTVMENILLPIEVNKEKFKHEKGYWEKKSIELIDKMELTGFKDYYPSQLSGGMQARVAIARSLIYNAPIFLLDEPFSSLDDITRFKLNYELYKITKENKKTIVFVTHNIEEALLLSDRIILLSNKPCSIKEIFEVSVSKDSRFTDVGQIEIEQIKNRIKALLYTL